MRWDYAVHLGVDYFSAFANGYPLFGAIEERGRAGRKKINQYTRYATIVLALVQGYAMSVVFAERQLIRAYSFGDRASFGARSQFSVGDAFDPWSGTCFVMWLGEQITERGIGNGSSLIIFSGIAAGLPSGAIRLYTNGATAK